MRPSLGSTVGAAVFGGSGTIAAGMKPDADPDRRRYGYGRGVDQAIGPWSPAVAAGQVSGRAGLVQEHEPLRVHVALPYAPAATISGDVRPVLLGSPRRLFLCDRPSRRSVLQIVEMWPPSIPHSASAVLISPG